MTTPTREQVIEWAKEAGFETRRDAVLVEGLDITRTVERLCALAISEATEAGRDQGLREAKEACQALGVAALGAQSGDPHELSNVMLRQVAKLGYGKCAAAIEQLRGK